MNLVFEDIVIDLSKNKESSTFGVEKLKEVSLEIVKLWKKIKDRASSGDKFSVWEKIRTGVDISNIGADLYNSLEQLKNEVIDLDKYEAKEVAAAIAITFGVSYSVAFSIVATIVVKTISIVLDTLEIYKNIKELI